MENPWLEDDNNHTVSERQWRYAPIAERILACLVHYGYGAKYSDFVPPAGVEYGDEVADEYENRWPHYFHKWGSPVTS
jgi:hypothetical protein